MVVGPVGDRPYGDESNLYVYASCMYVCYDGAMPPKPLVNTPNGKIYSFQQSRYEKKRNFFTDFQWGYVLAKNYDINKLVRIRGKKTGGTFTPSSTDPNANLITEVTVPRFSKRPLVVAPNGRSYRFFETAHSTGKPYDWGYIQCTDTVGNRRSVIGMVVGDRFTPDPEGKNAYLMRIAPLEPEDITVPDHMGPPSS